MSPTLVVRLRACCVAMALVLGASGAETKQSSLIGITREQVLGRLGEPRSQLIAGNREILFFSRERVVLEKGVVIEVGLLPSEPPRRPTPPAAATEPAVAEASRNAPATSSSPDVKPTQPSASSASSTTAPESDAPLVIKSVRPHAGGGVPPAPRSDGATTLAARPAGPAPAPPFVPSPAPNAPSMLPPAKAGEAAPDTPGRAAGVESNKKSDAPPNAPPATNEKKAAKPGTSIEPVNQSLPPPEEEIFTTQTYVIALAVIVGGAAYLVWRVRERRLDLAATAVENTPVPAAPVQADGARFTTDLLTKLEWKRFEELVALYYGKTGVVAMRTKAGPMSTVHVKISWKGEPQPFAFVQCIADPSTTIDVKLLEEFVAVLTAENIRRGTVATTGKFSMLARDFATQNHLTLHSGDSLLEKLNALPLAARREVMAEIIAGDYTTPSCPKCDAKMTRASDVPSGWRCVHHPDAKIRGRA